MNVEDSVLILKSAFLLNVTKLSPVAAIASSFITKKIRATVCLQVKTLYIYVYKPLQCSAQILENNVILPISVKIFGKMTSKIQ